MSSPHAFLSTTHAAAVTHATASGAHSTASGTERLETESAGDEVGDHPRKLRIALVAPPYFTVPPEGYGGIENMLACLADALVDDGHDVTLLGAGRTGSRARFVAVCPEPIPDRLGEIYPELVYAAQVRTILGRMARRGEIDVVHDHTNAGPLNAAIIASRGVPVLTTMHGPATSSDLCELYRALGDTIGLVAISDRQRQLAPDLNWLATIPNGIRVADWPLQRRKQDYALFLGRFCADKGAHTAIEAAHAAGVPLVLAGKCTEPGERRYFAEEVEPRLGPDDVVHGVTGGADKVALLASARCLLFPIQWEEPFGVVMIEAMACGTPVVALRAGAVPEVVAHGVSGLVCDSPAELPAALHAVRSVDPQACRRHVAEHFEAALIGPRHAAAYRLAIARAGGRRLAAGVSTQHRPAVLAVAPPVRRREAGQRRDRLAASRRP
jgi:glycosyltransferase involved in cell wall biosynthesis